MLKMIKKGETVKLKNYKRKIKSSLMIYGDFESILIPKNNGRWNSDEPYANKCQNNVGCGYCYKLVCVDDQFSKPFKLYLVQDAVHKFITNIFKESKYCSHVMKNYFK